LPQSGDESSVAPDQVPAGALGSPKQGRLAGQRCVIVGGAGGIGLATARRFLEEGARVVLADLAGVGQRETLAALEPLGHVELIEADVRDADSVNALFSRALVVLGGRLDVLFHVAGISGRTQGDGPLHECSDEGWQDVMELNARGTFFTNRAAVRVMRTQGLDASGLRGTVVNTGSVLAYSPSPLHFGTMAYAASKGAIQAFTLAAAAAYARERIRFQLIAPGLIDTPMAKRACNDPAIRQYLAAKQPIAGGPGEPGDVAEAALFLCEPASRFTTGIVLPVDGGWCISEGHEPREGAS
jgi:NAD(P)-dependent dehydrogenase (short-subunit alcohol dehydrogenase family)